MKNSYPKILLIGGDSFLGSHFNQYLKANKICSESTSRRFIYKILRQKKYLNLKEWERYKIPTDVTHAVIFAGISGYEACAKDPSSEQINVLCTVSLLEKLLETGIRTTFISSSAVFSASTEDADETTIVNPDSAYGEQKADAEKRAIQFAAARSDANFTIVRPSKIMHKNSKVFVDWNNCIEKNLPLSAYQDLFVSPISIRYFCQSLLKIIFSNQPGIYHLSGAESVSYFKLASLYVQTQNKEFENIVGVESSDNLFYKHATGKLVMKNTFNLLQIKPQEIVNFLADISSSTFLPK